MKVKHESAKAAINNPRAAMKGGLSASQHPAEQRNHALGVEPSQLGEFVAKEADSNRIAGK